MTALLTCLKKEYWEERSLLLGLPIGLAAILIMSLIIALFIGVRYSDQFDIDFNIGSWSSDHNGSSVPLNFTEGLQSYDDSHNLIQHESELNSMANSLLQRQPNQRYSANGLHDYGHNANNAISGLIFVFMSISWFAGLSYLLSSLYKDRKDKTSIVLEVFACIRADECMR